jgi:hypothetical protein
MTACFVPWPDPGTGGCPCGQYPDPCGSVGECLPQGSPPGVTCFPPAASCRKLGNCTTCDWIAPADVQVCGGGGAIALIAVVALVGAGGLVFAEVEHRRHVHQATVAPGAHRRRR